MYMYVCVGPSIVVHGANVYNLFLTKFSNVYLKIKKTFSKKQN